MHTATLRPPEQPTRGGAGGRAGESVRACVRASAHTHVGVLHAKPLGRPDGLVGARGGEDGMPAGHAGTRRYRGGHVRGLLLDCRTKGVRAWHECRASGGDMRRKGCYVGQARRPASQRAWCGAATNASLLFRRTSRCHHGERTQTPIGLDKTVQPQIVVRETFQKQTWCRQLPSRRSHVATFAPVMRLLRKARILDAVKPSSRMWSCLGPAM